MRWADRDGGCVWGELMGTSIVFDEKSRGSGVRNLHIYTFRIQETVSCKVCQMSSAFLVVVLAVMRFRGAHHA